MRIRGEPLRPQAPSSSGILLLVVGALVGAGLAGVIHAVTWTFDRPGGTFDNAVTYLEGEAPTSRVFQMSVALGAFLGLFATGVGLNNRGVLLLLRASYRLVVLTVSGLVGGLLGAIAYFLLWAYGNPQRTFGAAFDHLGRAIETTNALLVAFAVAGAISGLSASLYFFGSHLMQSAARNVTGAVLGGISGLVMYSVAYVLTYYPYIPDSSAYVVHFAEAIYAFDPVEYLFVILGTTVGLMMARYSWRLYGIFTLISLISVILGYLMYTTAVTFPKIPPEHKVLSLILFVAEACSLTMVVLYSFYTIDVATRKHWRRTPRDAPFSSYYMPKVAFQVPIYNEPAELVLDTLKSLLRIDYPGDRFVIMVVDDSTDPACSGPIQEFCQRFGVQYYHREDRRGFKAGALNHAMGHVPADAELIAIIDADYQVVPEFLKETVGFFANASLGWVQTPQDYRNRHQSFLTEQYYLADAYFYRSVLPSRNEENSIIFCGTMGILRRSALEEVGGWGEEYITEDAELSIRLVNHGWKSLYVNKTYGRGLIPATFAGYKRQHHRWAFGGGKILRGHFGDFLFGKFTGRQWYDYFLGNIHWFEGLFILVIAASVLAMGVADIMGSEVATHHANEIMLIGLVPIFLLVDGLTRLHMVLRKTLQLSFGGTFRVLGMWFAVKFSNAFGATKAFIGFTLPFLRTPKAPSSSLGRTAAMREAIRLTRFESTFAALLLATAIGVAVKIAASFESAGPLVVTRIVLLVWIFCYFLVFFAAPLYAYKSFVTFKPAATVLPAKSAVPGVPA